MARQVGGRSEAAPGPAATPSSATFKRRKPRDFEEWKSLAAWGKLPAWEALAAGYQLRRAREAAGLTQAELGKRLGLTQQAVARAERWDSNPTVRLLAAWAEALGARFELGIFPRDSPPAGSSE